MALPATARASTATSFSQLNILLVDDCPMHQAVMPPMLKNMGFLLVVTAKDGEEALAILAKKTVAVHVILTDYRMPKMDGVQLIQQVREKLKLAIPIVGYSGSTESEFEELIKKTALFGVKTWLAKPVSLALLESAFVKVLAPVK
jgi:CheY-like chemotaxis protein